MSSLDPLSVALLECREGRIVRADATFAALVEAEPAQGLEGRSPDDWLADAGEGLPDWSAGELACGSARAVECALRPEGGGEPRRVRLVPRGEGAWELHDVTGLRRLGEEARTLGSQLREARRELAEGREAAAGERARLDELLTVVSHELRTPVTVIAGFLKLLLAEEVGPLNGAQRRFVGECQRSVRRLDAFVANLMAHAPAGGGAGRGAGAEAALREASLLATAQSVAAFLKPLLEEGGARLNLELAHDAVRARFDPARVEQVLVNLIGNALTHGGAGGEITVSTRRLRAAGQDVVEVAVEDDGPGIPREARERIFEPYARLAEERGAGGLGLGLAICRTLVEAHGGTLVAGDARAGGARLAFTLPAADAPEEAEDAEKPPPLDAHREAPAR